jgi:outer membrane protein
MRTLALLAVLMTVVFAPLSTVSAAEGDYLLRVGASNVDPDDPNGSILSLDINVDDAWSMTFNGEWMWKKNWGIEVLAAWPFEHDINVQSLGKVGSTKHLPPTLSLNYHFLPDTKFDVYVGAGVNYTIFFDSDSSGALARDGSGGDLDVDDNSWGLAGQIGADWFINDKWFVNFNVRYIDIDTEAKVTLAPDSAIVPGGGRVSPDVDIDPWVYGVHVGYRF